MKRNHLQSKYSYHNSKKWSIIIFFVFALLSGNLFSQQKSKKKFKTSTSTKSIKKTSSYDISPFDLNRKQLPINYKGVNPILLYNQLEKKSRDLTKSEYETTIQYSERINLEKEKPLFGKIYTDSILAFVSDTRNIKYNYNADVQSLNIKMNLANYTNYYNDISFDFNRKSVMLDEIEKESTYLGSNAFGLSNLVDKTESNEYDLLFENWKNFNIPIKNSDALIEVNIGLDVLHAKQIIESDVLSCLFIGNLCEPYTCVGYSFQKPTISYPVEYITNFKYINLHVIEIWLFNKKTGEIYSKLKPINDNLQKTKQSNYNNERQGDDIFNQQGNDILKKLDKLIK
jgi:hypothetical protein